MKQSDVSRHRNHKVIRFEWLLIFLHRVCFRNKAPHDLLYVDKNTAQHPAALSSVLCAHTMQNIPWGISLSCSLSLESTHADTHLKLNGAVVLVVILLPVSRGCSSLQLCEKTAEHTQFQQQQATNTAGKQKSHPDAQIISCLLLCTTLSALLFNALSSNLSLITTF